MLPGDDAHSFLLLGDGTAMTVAEMEQRPSLFHGVDMLTLSACNTAVGGEGSEIDGLAGVARTQGAGAVMATLWSVTDPSTQQLMQSFYAARKSRGETNSAALRNAQLTLLHGGDTAGGQSYAHPYFWAPFILMGEPVR
jgi:CHAT domain-containing protein